MKYPPESCLHFGIERSQIIMIFTRKEKYLKANVQRVGKHLYLNTLISIGLIRDLGT